MIESIFQGVLTFGEVKEFICEEALLSKENNCRFFLTDYLEVRLELSTLQIYEVPKLLQDTFALLGLDVRLLRRAVVVAEDLRDYKFYEDVAVNQGQKPKVFTDIDEAKKWLAENQHHETMLRQAESMAG